MKKSQTKFVLKNLNTTSSPTSQIQKHSTPQAQGSNQIYFAPKSSRDSKNALSPKPVDSNHYFAVRFMPQTTKNNPSHLSKSPKSPNILQAKMKNSVNFFDSRYETQESSRESKMKLEYVPTRKSAQKSKNYGQPSPQIKEMARNTSRLSESPFSGGADRFKRELLSKQNLKQQEKTIRCSILELELDGIEKRSIESLRDMERPMMNDNNITPNDEQLEVYLSQKNEPKEDHEKNIKLHLDLSPIIQKQDDISFVSRYDLTTNKGSIISDHRREAKDKGSPGPRINCTSHPTKKAKYYTDATKNRQYLCSNCAVRTALEGKQVIDLVTAESTCRDSKEKLSETLCSSPRNHKSMNKSISSDYHSIRRDSVDLAKRREDIGTFIAKLGLQSSYFPEKEEKLYVEKAHLQMNLNSITERIESFSKQVVKIIKEQTESTMAALNVDYGKEFLRIDEENNTLRKCQKDFDQIRADIERNFENILYMDDQPYKIIMEKYQEKLDVIGKTSKPKDHSLLIPNDKLTSFKRKVKTILNEILAEAINGIQSPSPMASRREESQSPPKIHQYKNLGEFENFLKSDESENDLRVKNIRAKTADSNVIISFKDKEIFENALKNSDVAAINSTQDTKFNTLNSNLFRSETEDMSNYMARETVKTPRLNCEGSGILSCDSADNLTTLYQDYNSIGHNLPDTSVDTVKYSKFVNLIEKVNQRNNSINLYLRKGSRPEKLEEYDEFVNFLEDQLQEDQQKDPNYQKTLFTSPVFKETLNSQMNY